jgi:hypothetical protein
MIQTMIMKQRMVTLPSSHTDTFIPPVVKIVTQPVEELFAMYLDG